MNIEEIPDDIEKELEKKVSKWAEDKKNKEIEAKKKEREETVKLLRDLKKSIDRLNNNLNSIKRNAYKTKFSPDDEKSSTSDDLSWIIPIIGG